ncbi:FBXL2_20 [Lepeophtheirus salmonis]|uniref:FBXL2_20 n=1 Tax=Lepeophtheirus salmonis TaxID=72036 RepID=A0A7R8CZW4_LEPSM|nr:FBXL2_20 [Lepeophtheirus salmonis]CAF2978456.1 FBXL2_20 [Lepeophtheirus salmonis]
MHFFYYCHPHHFNRKLKSSSCMFIKMRHIQEERKGLHNINRTLKFLRIKIESSSFEIPEISPFNMTRYGRETNGHSSSRRKSSGSIKPSGIPSTNNGFTNSHHNNNNPHTSDVYQVSRNGSTANSWSKLGNRVFGEGDESLINRKLPKELLLRIFSHLDVVSLCRCAQVSKSWNVLALDGSNWQRVDLFEFQIDIEGVVVENIARRCGGFLRELSLRGCQAVGDNALATFSQHCNNIDDLSLTALSQGCNNIYHLDISWCDLVTAKGLKALSDGCRKLQHFISKGCLHISDEALIHLARNCKLLQTVNIQGCRNVQDDGVILLAENCPDLRYLCVSNCGHLTDSTLLALASNCPQLSKLECAAVSQLTDTGFQALAKNCHLLERLDLEECVLITDATLSVLSAYCPRMESVSLSHCELITDEGIRQLGLSPCSSEHLTVLELDNLPLITDTSLDHLVSVITCRELNFMIVS